MAAYYLQLTENNDHLLTFLTYISSMGGQINSVEDLTKAVEQVSAKDVIAVANKLVKGKVAIAAVGQVGNVPYAEDLI